MGKHKIYTYNSFTGGLKEVCKHFDVSYMTVYLRIQKGMSLEEAIEVPVRKKGKIYTYNGFSGTLSEICDHFVVKYSTIKNRMRKGLSLKDTIEIPIKEKGEIYSYQGFNGSLPEICKHFGVSCDTVYQRIQNEMSFEEAVEVPLQNHSLKKIWKYNDQKGTIRDLCEINNKDFISVYNLMKSNHTIEWSIEHGEEKV